jgi:hypothetical protein
MADIRNCETGKSYPFPKPVTNPTKVTTTTKAERYVPSRTLLRTTKNGSKCENVKKASGNCMTHAGITFFQSIFYLKKILK